MYNANCIKYFKQNIDYNILEFWLYSIRLITFVEIGICINIRSLTKAYSIFNERTNEKRTLCIRYNANVVFHLRGERYNTI